jgi:anti-anti-sigma regulatory factor
MLRIDRTSNGVVVLTLSGRVDADAIGQLERMVEEERRAHPLVLDLRDVTLVDRDAVIFLGRCVDAGITLVQCSPYIREWIARESS